VLSRTLHVLPAAKTPALLAALEEAREMVESHDEQACFAQGLMSSGLSSQQLPVQAEPVANVRSFPSPKCLASSSKPGACNSKSLALVEQTENERLAAAPAAAAADGYVCVGGERRGGGRGEGGEGGEWNRGAGVVEEEKEESGSADVDDHDMDMGERAIADPALAGVDFFMEEPATRSQAHPQHSATSLVEYSPWASGQKVGRHRREEEGADRPSLKQVEQYRRIKANEYFEELRDLLPPSRGTKCDRNRILQEAIEYVKELKGLLYSSSSLLIKY